MAFDPNTQDFDTYLQAAIQQGVTAAMAAQTPAAVPGAPPTIPSGVPPATPAPASGVTLMVDGQPYTFQNAEEASAAVQETLNQQRAANQAQPAATPDTPKPDDKPAFDQNQYVSLMGSDPVGAANYIDQFRDNAVEGDMQALKDKVQTTDRMLAAYQFKDSHPEFAFMQNGAQVIETIMKTSNWDFSPNNLEAALAIAQSRGQLPTRDQIQQQLQANAAAQNQTAGQGQVASTLPALPAPSLPAPQPGQVPTQVPLQGAVPPQLPPAPVAVTPIPGGSYGNPPHLDPSLGPNPTYPVTNVPQAPPGVVMPPPTIGTPTAGGLPSNWVDQADNLTPEQIEQIFNQQVQQ